MAKWRPSKWLVPAVFGTSLPLLAAYVTTTGGLKDDLASRAGQAVSANEQTAWAKLESSGRDFVIQGTAPSQEALDAAIKSVANTYGVRTVTNSVQIVAPVVMSAPEVESLVSTTAIPELKGSWNEGVATSLAVTVGETTYKLGESPELTSIGGNWLLKLTQPLAEGTYDVKVESSDGKVTLSSSAPGKLVVDLPDVPPLPLPTVENFIGNTATPTFKGTWPEVAAKAGDKNLQVKLGETMFVLGKNPELSSDGAGNWQLVPSMPLLEGELSIMPGVVGADGKWVKAEAPGTAVIDLTPPPLAELAAPAADLKWPFAIVGKWPEIAGNSLSALFAGKTFEANAGEELKTDGKGNFTFDPKTELAPGSYDLNVLVKDAAGNVAEQKLAAAVVVPDVTKAEPAKVEAATVAIVDPLPDPSTWPFVISGSWDEKPGNTLSASVGGRSYVLGRGAALTSAGTGRFNFQPAAKFAPGTYDIDITTTDTAGSATVKTLKSAILVAEPKPVVIPTVAAVIDPVPAGAVWPYAINGSWDAKPGNSLSASVNGRTYVLGRGAALTSPEAGKFSFAPSATFAPGSYDVDFATTDSSGSSIVTTAKAVIVVPESAPKTVVAETPVVENPAAEKPKVDIPAPTVVSQLDLTGAPIIKGTWASNLATKLSVSVDGRTYVLGADANLAVKDGNWTLLPGTALKDGTYDVAVEAADAAGNAAKDTTTNELVVDGEPPAAPTVMTMSGDASPDHLSGTWDEAQAKSLKVTVPQLNLSAELGAAGSALISDGSGKWRLNLATPLPPGSYNVLAETKDEHGRVQSDSSDGEVVVVAKGQPVPQPPVYDCVAVMDRIGRVFPIRFEFDLTDITKPFDLSVSQYAALLKDARCTSLNVEVKGHADFKGTEIYNMGLSERRADVIVNMLKDAGVEASRMSILPLGESQPLDPAESDEARMKNRRVEITVKP